MLEPDAEPCPLAAVGQWPRSSNHPVTSGAKIPVLWAIVLSTPVKEAADAGKRSKITQYEPAALTPAQKWVIKIKARTSLFDGSSRPMMSRRQRVGPKLATATHMFRTNSRRPPVRLIAQSPCGATPPRPRQCGTDDRQSNQDKLQLTTTPARFVERIPTKMFAPVSQDASSVENPSAAERYCGRKVKTT